jgi:GAF domain-containing protein/HAMP domain-containing protein
VENKFIAASLFDRLLSRLRGRYLFWLNFLSLFLSDLAAAVGIYYIISATDLSIRQIYLLIISLSTLSLIANLIISVYVFYSTSSTRKRLDSYFNKTQRNKGTDGEVTSLVAWQEIYTLPARTVLVNILSLALLVILPSVIVLRLTINLDLSQTIHIILGCSISAISIVIIHNLFLERILEPVRKFLFSPTVEIYRPPFISRISTRLSGIVTFLISSTIIILAGIGFQRSINAALPDADLSFEISQFQMQAAILGLMILVLGVFMGRMNASSVSRPIRDLLTALKHAQEGDYLHTANIFTSDETSQLANQFNILLTKLHNSTTNLERQVEDRTEDLNRRTKQLQIVTRIIQEISSVDDLNMLIMQAVQLISENFGYYHVGIFLSDTRSEYAILQASSSEGGKLMMARGYKREINKNDLIGRSILENRLIIIHDISQELTYQINPDLPQTASLIILPLESHGNVIGAIDVQAAQPYAFSNDDQEILQTLVNQVSLTILNIRLVEENRLAFQRLETTLEENIRQAWREFSTGNKLAYRYTPTSLLKLDDTNDKPADSNRQEILSVPINVHEQKIGSIEVIRRGQNTWEESDKFFLTNITSQIGLALENSRLLNTTQQRVYYEQSLSALTARLGLSIDTDTLLESAIRELHQLPNVTEVSVKLSPPEETKPVE